MLNLGNVKLLDNNDQAKPFDAWGYILQKTSPETYEAVQRLANIWNTHPELGKAIANMVAEAIPGIDFAKLYNGQNVDGTSMTKVDTGLAMAGILLGGIAKSGKLIKEGKAALKVIEDIADDAAKLSEGATGGKNIVGTTFNEIKPTQDIVNPEKVAEYARKLKAGEKVEPIQVVEVQGKKYIVEGHHRYIASQQTGIPVEIKVTQGNGPTGMSDWSNVQWKEYVNEDQFWGD